MIFFKPNHVALVVSPRNDKINSETWLDAKRIHWLTYS
jgi:hypothetical protein